MRIQPDGRLDEAAASPEAVRDGTDGLSTASSSTLSNPPREELPSSPHAHTSEPHHRDGGVLTIYCHGNLTTARWLLDGVAVCSSCRERIRVVA